MPVEDLSKIFSEGYFASIWDEGGMQTQNKVKQFLVTVFLALSSP